MKHTPATKPVAETWFSIEAYDSDVLRFREHNIDAYASGDFWLVRGDDEALVVDTGCDTLRRTERRHHDTGLEGKRRHP